MSNPRPLFPISTSAYLHTPTPAAALGKGVGDLAVEMHHHARGIHRRAKVGTIPAAAASCVLIVLLDNDRSGQSMWLLVCHL